MKDIMENQCFEMNVKVSMGKLLFVIKRHFFLQILTTYNQPDANCSVLYLGKQKGSFEEHADQ